MDETCSNGRAISIIFVIIFRKADWINSRPWLIRSQQRNFGGTGKNPVIFVYHDRNLCVTIICGAERKRGEGHIVRAEGALDKETGLLHAVAEVRDPYAVKTGRAPLMPGLFVNAEIVGRD